MYSTGGKDEREGNTQVEILFFSQVYVLETAPRVGMVGSGYIPRTGEGGEEPPNARIQLRGSADSHVLSMTSSNKLQSL